MSNLDPSSQLILDEARRRGITVQILTPRAEYFRLTFGPRSIVCYESLSEITSAVAASRCEDKRITAQVLAAAGLRTPAHCEAGDERDNLAFLREHGSLVVKPAHGEQGKGVSVGVRTPQALRDAIVRATDVGEVVLLEQVVPGDDLRVLVIGGKVIAAAVRKPPIVIGDGERSVEALIAAQSLRRQAQTAGESKIPLDDETRRCVREAGYELEDLPPRGARILVRKAANLHTGGTIHDVTDELPALLNDVAVRAAEALSIPVVGLDLIVPTLEGGQYWIIEANERPGLANHEPQPTAARFVDFLFPETVE